MKKTTKQQTIFVLVQYFRGQLINRANKVNNIWEIVVVVSTKIQKIGYSGFDNFINNKQITSQITNILDF